MKRLIGFLVALAFAVFSLYPIVYVISVSLRGDQAFQSRTLDLFSANSTLQNYRVLLFETDFLIWLRNSVFVSAAATLTGLALASTSA